MANNYTHCLAEYEQIVSAYVNGWSDLSLDDVEDHIWEAYSQDDITKDEYERLHAMLHN